METRLVNKEFIDKIQFVKQEVLGNPSALEQRLKTLNKALKLGNNHKCHVRITARDILGVNNEIEATVWGVTEKYVILKGDRFIPIKSIVGVELM